jgi:hypothetical protein
MPHLKRIYTDLKIDGFDEYKDKFVKYVKSQADYKPGKHEISDDIIRKVNDNWDFIREMQGYEKLEPKGKK